MKNAIVYLIISAVLFAAGCSRPNAKTAAKKENKHKKTFMFWAFRKEMKQSRFTVPGVTSEQDKKNVLNHLRTLPGIINVRWDVNEHLLTVEYEGSTIRTMNIEDKIAQAGFTVNGRPAASRGITNK